MTPYLFDLFHRHPGNSNGAPYREEPVHHCGTTQSEVEWTNSRTPWETLWHSIRDQNTKKMKIPEWFRPRKLLRKRRRHGPCLTGPYTLHGQVRYSLLLSFWWGLFHLAHMHCAILTTLCIINLSNLFPFFGWKCLHPVMACLLKFWFCSKALLAFDLLDNVGMR